MKALIRGGVIIFFFLMLVFSACGDRNYKTLYHETISFPSQQWKSTFKPTFSFEIKDTTQIHMLKMIIRTTSSFPYANLWLKLSISGPKSFETKFEVPITDDAGKWLGEKSGSVVNISKIIVKNKNFPKPGKYNLTFEQVSIPAVIPELVDLTVDLFEKVDKK